MKHIATEEIKSGYALEPTLFGKWPYKGIECEDISLDAYASVKPTKVTTFGWLCFHFILTTYI